VAEAEITVVARAAERTVRLAGDDLRTRFGVERVLNGDMGASGITV
jgi:hypothetical protein